MRSFLFRSIRAVTCVAIIAVALLAPKFSAARTEIPDAAQPQLATAADGRVWLTYGREGAVFVAVSNDGGATFGSASKLPSPSKVMVGMRRGPRIAVLGDRVTITVVGDELVAFRSADAGKTWSGPVTINEVPASAHEGLHDLASSPDGQLFVTWLDLRSGKMELWGAESADGGKTWSKNEQVYRSPDQSICECCHPTALFDRDGNLAVMWRNSVAGSRDLWMTTRARGAKHFTAAKKLGEGTWKLNGCPMDGGKIVALGHGKFGSVWQRAGDVFFAPADGPEVLLGKGKQPIAIARGAEIIIFWQQGADLVSVHQPGDEPMKQAADARFASLIALPISKAIVLAYEQGSAKEKQPGVVIEPL